VTVAALFPAIPIGTIAHRGSDTKGSRAVVTNGSKIVVPEGYGLLLFQEGQLTTFVDEPGGYVWIPGDLNSQSIFTRDDSSASFVRQSWERFKFGGRPATQQLALFVRMKELPNNRFGTQSKVYWDDAYLNSQVGALTHGTYSLNIVDPIVFAKEFVPATYLQALDIFDFTDRTDVAAHQLFSEVVGSLTAAFSSYTNDAERGNRINDIQRDSVGFAKSLSSAVEEAYRWKASRGLAITKVTIVGIEYDEQTKELLKTVQRRRVGRHARGCKFASLCRGRHAVCGRGGRSGRNPRNGNRSWLIESPVAHATGTHE
jgi:membrane protease subunit (stomatin/prohibitin family)